MHRPLKVRNQESRFRSTSFGGSDLSKGREIEKAQLATLLPKHDPKVDAGTKDVRLVREEPLKHAGSGQEQTGEFVCELKHVAPTTQCSDVACTTSLHPSSSVMSHPIQAIKITGCPEAYQRFEAGTFVNNKMINGKPSFACAFQAAGQDAVEYALWWSPEKQVFTMGPSTNAGGTAGFLYVPGDESAMDPTEAKLQWVAFDFQTRSWAAVPCMNCFKVSVAGG